MAKTKKLTQRQQQTLLYMIQLPTFESAAAQAGVSARTIHNWMQLPAFRAEYERLRREIFQNSLNALARFTDTVIAKIMILVASPTESIALGACRTALEFAQRDSEQ